MKRTSPTTNIDKDASDADGEEVTKVTVAADASASKKRKHGGASPAISGDEGLSTVPGERPSNRSTQDASEEHDDHNRDDAVEEDAVPSDRPAKAPGRIKREGGGRVRLPEKLLHFLNEEPVPNVIWWMPDGKGFAMSSETVQTKLLDRHFRCTKLASFIRSLNRWGFRRVFYHALPPDVIAFYHPLFKRDALHRVKEIKMVPHSSHREEAPEENTETRLHNSSPSQEASQQVSNPTPSTQLQQPQPQQQQQQPQEGQQQQQQQLPPNLFQGGSQVASAQQQLGQLLLQMGTQTSQQGAAGRQTQQQLDPGTLLLQQIQLLQQAPQRQQARQNLSQPLQQYTQQPQAVQWPSQINQVLQMLPQFQQQQQQPPQQEYVLQHQQQPRNGQVPIQFSQQEILSQLTQQGIMNLLAAQNQQQGNASQPPQDSQADQHQTEE